MRKILLSLLLFLVAASLSGQKAFKNRLGFGVEAGPQFSSIHYGDFINVRGRIPFGVENYLQYEVFPLFKINFGLSSTVSDQKLGMEWDKIIE